MATKKSQRIGIWVIAVVMLVGTLTSFLVLILAPNNEAADQARIQQLTEEYQTAVEAYQERQAAQMAKFTDNADELSSQYYGEFSKYEDRAMKFDAGNVQELGKDDIKVGDGETVTSNDAFAAYYIGWNPDGKIFDSSLEENKLKAPIVAQPGGVISGWTEGIDGMKVGGVRELTIPAEQAYGESGSGEDIPPNTPLKFIVMVIEKVDALQQPEIPEELLRQYGNQ